MVAMGGHATGAAPPTPRGGETAGWVRAAVTPSASPLPPPGYRSTTWSTGTTTTFPLDTSYVAEIVASCGGDPVEEPDARDECLQRSPVTHLDAARDAELPVYLAAEWMADVAG
ncbi:hypothetical protein BH23ACT2_BH23ACT2_24020 [soil metagenome]